MQKCFYRGNIEIGPLELSQRESHHLCNVMRARAGEEVVVLNGDGIVARGKLSVPDGKCAEITVEKMAKKEKPENAITLLQATLKGNRNEYVIREGTAIGVGEIIFFEARNSECKLGEKIGDKLTRWESVAIEGCKQSGNPFLPKIFHFERFQKIDLSPFAVKFFCGLGEDSRLLGQAIAAEKQAGKQIGKRAENYCVAIGPEGDFSEFECDHMRRNGFTECKLSKNILRSETAAIYALSAMDQLLND
jgi:16S rRNA (uracil1498-N3)-methyltransferase